MSVEQLDKVDFISFDKKSGDVWLTISDHLAWDKGEDEHLLVLQEKINGYLQFILSGDLLKEVPTARGHQVVINVHGKFPLSSKAEHFYRKAADFVEKAGYKLQFVLYTPDMEMH